MTLAKGPGRKGHAGAASAAMNSPPRPTTLAGAAVPAAMGAPASCRPGLFLALRADRLSFRRKSAKPLRRKSRPQGVALRLPCDARPQRAGRNSPCAIYRSGLRHASLFPRCGLRFSARLTAHGGVSFRLGVFVIPAKAGARGRRPETTCAWRMARRASGERRE